MSRGVTEGRVSPAQVTADVVSIRRAPARREELVAMLAEQSPIYRDLSSGETDRIRGFVLASFERVGLPDTALPFVLEELETGINPYTVAAAARAMRGAPAISDKAFALLVAAAVRIENNDDNVQYDSIDPGDRSAARTSALVEIIRSIGASGSRARHLWTAIDAMASRGNVVPEAMMAIEQARTKLSGDAQEQCCCGAVPPALAIPAKSGVSRDVGDLVLEDQSGTTLKYGDFFRGRPSVVTFFYTRCMNPRKCSLTVSKLSGLQRRLAETDLASRINIGVFTYDPAYDRSSRLQTYGVERGFRFDAHNRFLRTVDSFEPLQAKFDLGVGFGPATINRHSVELLILNSAGETVRQFRRIQWNEAEVLQAIRQTPHSGNAG
jgi:cytochrome oxidase Cu insertion factor (SCO1/SenC/PrrC family)